MNRMQLDSSTITKILSKMVTPLGTFEIRLLKAQVQGNGGTYTASGFFKGIEIEKVLSELEKFDRAQGVYFTLNSLNPALYERSPGAIRTYVPRGEATKDADILTRDWVLLDIDPIRPSETSASNEEKQAGEQVLNAAVAFLKAEAFPDPVLIDSGNGYHAYIRVDLPVEDGGLVRRFLRSLAAKFDTEKAKVDVTVHNPARIVKLPGTLAAKGENTLERPHRRSTILHFPQDIKIASFDLIEKVAAMGEQPRPSKKDRNTQHNGDQHGRQSRICLPKDFNFLGFLDEQGIAHQPAKPLDDGALLIELESCVWNPDHQSSAFIVLFQDGGIHAGCHHNSCSSFGAVDFFTSLKKRFETEGRKGAAEIIQGILELSQSSSFVGLEGDALDQRLAQIIRTEFGLASRFVARYGSIAMYVEAWQKWIAFDGVKWCVSECSSRRLAEMTIEALRREAFHVQ